MNYDVFDLLLSFVLTWLLGLGMPALVRFTLYRRALLASEALTWSVGLALAEFALFVVLGSRSKTHVVLLVIGWVSYKLLQLPRGRWDKRPIGGTQSGAPMDSGAVGSGAPGPGSGKGVSSDRPGAGAALPRLGPRRLASVLAVLSFTGFGGSALWQQHRHMELMGIAQDMSDTQEARRNVLVNQYVEEVRSRFAAVPKINGYRPELDEAQAREHAHRLVSNDESQLEMLHNMREAYAQAYAAEGLRNVFAAAALCSPALVWLLLLVWWYVAAGFRADAQRHQPEAPAVGPTGDRA